MVGFLYGYYLTTHDFLKSTIFSKFVRTTKSVFEVENYRKNTYVLSMILGTLFFAITLNNVGDGRKRW
jgi:hypothetical protein